MNKRGIKMIFDVRYLWVAANEKCRGYYEAESRDVVIKKMENNGNKVLSIKETSKGKKNQPMLIKLMDHK